MQEKTAALGAAIVLNTIQLSIFSLAAALARGGGKRQIAER
jgi:hypothetical protein